VSTPDRPISRREADTLGRWALAKTIYDLIATMPVEDPVRIGIYGGWGEGKTSVMRLVETLARSAGLPVCWFPAWTVETTADLWSAFAAALQSVTEVTDPALRTKHWYSKAVTKTSQLAEVNPYTKTAHALAQLAAPWMRVDKADAERLMNSIAGGGRIVVMIDDLDRADAAIIPKLLMGLHDLFDQIGKCAFVVALDPAVVSSGLGKLNPAWSSAPAFLEKIIQYPFWLRDSTDEQIRRLALEAVRSHRPVLPEQAILDVLDLLPRNPRKLKQFFRSLERLAPTIHRHDDGELVRNASPEVSDSLFAERAFISDLVAGPPIPNAYGRPAERDYTLQTHIETVVNRVLAAAPDHERKALSQRLIEIVAATSERSLLLLATQLEQHLGLEQSPPVMTMKEFKFIAKQLIGSQEPAALKQLLTAHQEAVERSRGEVLEAFARKLIEHRDDLLQEADGALTEEAARAFHASADRLMSVLENVVIYERLFADSDIRGRVQLFIALRNHHSQWLNRAIDSEAGAMRARERAVLFRAAQDLQDRCVDVFRELKPWDATSIFDEISGAAEIKAVRERLLEMFGAFVAQSALARFERRGGIEAVSVFSLQNQPEMWILLNPVSPFHRSECRLRLRSIAQSGGQGTTENFFMYLQMIVGEEGSGFVPSSLIRDPELMQIVWDAARTLKPSGRVRETLLRLGKTVQERLAGKATIVLPSWAGDDPTDAVAAGLPEQQD
jgi:hypothetical protein